MDLDHPYTNENPYLDAGVPRSPNRIRYGWQAHLQLTATGSPTWFGLGRAPVG